MNVGELKEMLDDWGDHLPVAVVIEMAETSRVYKTIEVDDASFFGELTVCFTVQQGEEFI